MTCPEPYKPISPPRNSCEDVTEEKCSQKPQRTEECIDVESEESGLYRSLASNYSSNLYNNHNSRNN